jgi:hypothetical protein
VLETGAGEWQVNIDVEAKKVAVDTAGVESAIAMNDLIEIGVFGPPPAGEDRGRLLHLSLYRVQSGRQTITIVVPERPASAGIDPRHLLIDVLTSDNFMEVTNPSASNRK